MRKSLNVFATLLFSGLLIFAFSCDRKKKPIYQETVSFEQNSAYLPFDLYKDGQRLSLYATVNIKWVTTSDYKLQAYLTQPDGEVMSAELERIPEREVNPMETGKGGMVELKRQEASTEYRLFTFISKNGPYEIELLRDMGFMGAELDSVEIRLVPE